MFDVILLGTSGTMPLPDRPTSSVLGRLGRELILFDCGEGTQVSMRRWGWGFKGLSAICVSHRHGDHIAGLPGVLQSVARSGREDPVEIFGPPGIRVVVDRLRVVARYLPFEVRVRELRQAEGITWNGATLATLPVDHAVPCLAYRLDVARARRFDPERSRTLGVPVEAWKTLQHGSSVTFDGRVVGPEDVLGPSRRGIRFAYVTDTRPTPQMPAFLADADLLVIEGNYGDPEDAENAVENKHLLFSEAAQVGKDADVRQVWLTHFSAKMTEPERFAVEATRVFPATTVGYEGLATTLRFEDEIAETPA